MTSTNTPKLTGAALIKRVEANLETHDVHALAELTGYDNLTEWAYALKEAKDAEKQELYVAKARLIALCSAVEVDLEAAAANNNEDAIVRMASTIGGVAYRWLTYEYALQNGFEDDQLAAQQKEFEEQLIRETKLLRVVLGTEAGMLVTDTLMIQANLLAYVRAPGWKIHGEKGTTVPAPNGSDEQWEKNFTGIRDWALQLPLFQEMLGIATIGSFEKVVEGYNKQQRPRCSTIAAYLRTQMLDFAEGTNYCESESYKADLDSANLYVHYLNENCEWTHYAIKMVVWSCLTYDFRLEDQDGSLDFGCETIDAMADRGKAVASKNKA